MSDDQKSAMQRRTVIRGAAWAVPSLAIAASAPAIAASQECTAVTSTYVVTETVVTVNVPAEAQYVDYLVRGAGGGGGGGGDGALGEGRITFGAGSPRQLRVIVGAGGETKTDGTSAAGGWGFGRGGHSTPGPRENAGAPTGGGGGGSAILVGTTPVVVAGGGGGTAISQSLSGSTKLVQTHFEPFQGLQFGRPNAGVGNGNGRAGGMGGANATATGMVVGPALGASGASGGRRGGTTWWVTDQNANWTDRQGNPGFDGGDLGTGVNGGGDGGRGADRLSNDNGSGGGMRASSGGGGGGYAGGGGGGMFAATYREDNRLTISAGSGAAGSNHVLGSGSGLGLTVSHDGWRNSGLEGPANGGHPGFVRLSWCV